MKINSRNTHCLLRHLNHQSQLGLRVQMKCFGKGQLTAKWFRMPTHCMREACKSAMLKLTRIHLWQFDWNYQLRWSKKAQTVCLKSNVKEADHGIWGLHICRESTRLYSPKYKECKSPAFLQVPTCCWNKECNEYFQASQNSRWGSRNTELELLEWKKCRICISSKCLNY